MNTPSYFCRILGECPKKAETLHASTKRRIRAFGIAIHIPVMIWAITGSALGIQVLGLGPYMGVLVGFFCAALIYLVELLVLAAPSRWYVSIGRLAIGAVIAILGSALFDLTLFDKEISSKIYTEQITAIRAEYGTRITAQEDIVLHAQGDWLRATDAAACEANGTCGSGKRDLGPIYLAAKAKADVLREDYNSARSDLEEIRSQQRLVIERLSSPEEAAYKSGLLERISALHDYLLEKPAAAVGWFLIFVLLLFFELLVVLVKLLFEETADDLLARAVEEGARQVAINYMQAMRSPLYPAMRLMDAAM